MKRLMLTLTGLFISALTYTQLSISGSFNWTEPGLYYTIGLAFTAGHHRLGAGLNINQGFSPGYNYDVKWNLKPHSLKELFGFNLSYNYVFYPKYSGIQPYLFVDLNYQYCGQRISLTHANFSTSNLDPEPFNTFTETMGFGFTTQIYKQLYLDSKIGAGIFQQNTFDHFSFLHSAITYKASAGLTILLNGKKN